MKLTLLVDNNTFIDQYYIGEPGFCAYLEDGDTRLLFDFGYSSAFLQNARKMGIELADLNCAAVSHGHSDHTWGLESLLRYYTELEYLKRPHNRPVLFAHPETFRGVSGDGFSEIGSLIGEDKLKKFFELRVSRGVQNISERLIYLGEIPRRNDFEGGQSFGFKDGAAERDHVPEDTAVVYKAAEGIVILTGCSHSGICNIVEYAKEVSGEERILCIIGGLHLLNPSPERLHGTIAYLGRQKIAVMYPCHCTDLKSKIALSTVVNVEEAGVGLSLEFL